MIKQVGPTVIQAKHKASCHCGGVELELRIIKGEALLKLYQFNTHTAKHYFCSNCGIYTHHQRRSSPDEYGFNLGCLEGVNPYDIGEVPLMDGVNHPADR
ncbi:GFA family protein [Vibrio vulnificus]|nr:GFA family protein [Vibrio vulnificus]